MNKNKELSEIIDVVNAHQRFLLSSHINPEGDALGSQLAFAGVLESMNKEVVMVNNHPVPKRYNFLPSADRILSLKEYNVMTQGVNNIDVTILLDCPSIERIGVVKKAISENSILVNIDHHPSNSYFADINYVDSSASSTCQILFDLFDLMNSKNDISIATSLYTGILTDTGGFKHSNTTSKTHMVISKLFETGIKPNKIFSLLYERWPIERLKLLAKVLGSIKSELSGKFIYMRLTPDMLQEANADKELSEDFIDYCLSIAGVEVAAFFRIGDEYIKINFRSRGKIDVNKIASKYGGGGHVKASGCRVKGSFVDVKEKIKKDIKDILNSK